ncbi:hypothetical protein AB0K00_22560 [Dactylosporangium sp. NPDC049525]|uniref:hypothetical protein n=1 Tax=Dactylosporangium sp. NPDC049525 TaxID=3154730 RepID=UPI00343A6907
MTWMRWGEQRMRAVDMFETGCRQVDVVNALGVTAQAASRWYHAWPSGGRDALVGAVRLGRRPRLSDEQIGQVEAALLAGPKAHGFATDMWTLARVADVIERVTVVAVLGDADVAGAAGAKARLDPATTLCDSVA